MTYSGDPATSPVDLIRFLIQDTNATPLLTDAELIYTIGQWKNMYMAAAEAASVIGTRYSGFSDKTVGPLRVRYTDLAKRYFDLAKDLKTRASLNTGAVAITTQVPDRGPTFVRDGMINYGNTMPLLGSQQ